jgi:hypothetical protein
MLNDVKVYCGRGCHEHFMSKCHMGGAREENEPLCIPHVIYAEYMLIRTEAVKSNDIYISIRDFNYNT